MSQLETASERSPQHPGWRVVLVCFFVALFSWGFAFYGHGVYLAEFGRLYGWSASSISLASTLCYVLSALLVVFVSDAVARLGARRFLLAGIGCLAASGALLAGVTQYWQLVAVYLLMAFGWAGMGVAAITNILGHSFREKRGLAISLALNGASLSGVLFVPPLVAAAGYVSFSAAMLGASAIMLIVLLPLVLLYVPREAVTSLAAENGGTALLQWSRAQALRDIRFWSVTTPFAFAITAQAGFLVHQIAYLSPVIGREPAALAVAVTTGFAVIGRVGLGFVIDRLDHRMASAASFLSQTLALGVMAVSDSTSVLLVCCAVYGFSVGNLITFPALIIQREFAPVSFGMLIGLCTAIGQFIYAFGPGLIGIVRDASGGYTAALVLCGVFNAIAAVIILMKPRFSGMVAPG